MVKSVHKSLDELLLQPPAPSAPPENPKKVQRKTVAELKEAVVGKWVSDDADRILVEFGADGSFSLALYGQDWKWRMAKGTYVVNDDGMVKYQAKLGGLGIRGHFAMKDGALIHPTGANYQTRWKKLPKNGDPPVAPQRDPEDAFAKACALVAALAATSGMSGPAI